MAISRTLSKKQPIVEADQTPTVYFLQFMQDYMQSNEGSGSTRNFVFVTEYGAVGDGETNDTAAIQQALDENRCVVIPEGDWVVDYLNVPAGTTIMTFGHATAIHRAQGVDPNIRIINVVGSNVIIGSLTVVGDIATATGEQTHGIYIRANSTNGSIDNVVLGDIFGVNIRGDVVYAGAVSGFTLTNLTMGQIVGENVYRNIVAITGADNVTIAGIDGEQIGYAAFDIEPEATYVPVNNVSVGAIRGRLAAIGSVSSAVKATGISIGTMDLNGTRSQSVPSYAPGVAIDDGFLFRNCQSCSIGTFKAEEYGGNGISQIFNTGELADQYLSIDVCEINDCNSVFTTGACINCSGGNPIFRIGTLRSQLVRNTDNVIRNATRGTIDFVKFDTGANTAPALLRDSNDVFVGKVFMSGDGILFNNCDRIACMGGSIAATANRIVSNSQGCLIACLVATVTSVDGGSGLDHVFVNCSINGSYYNIGNQINDYTRPIYSNPASGGTFDSLWFAPGQGTNGKGQLRRLGGIPTSQFDGLTIDSDQAQDTNANLASKTAAINTTGKFGGKLCWDETNKKMYRAAGSTDVSDWEPTSGAGGAITPV